MTIGEKIKYFRTSIGISQSKLAEISGIHSVSIRKYEINKMILQAQQIDRIAEALSASSSAIAGFENNIRLETISNFKGLLIMLIKTKIVVAGKRGTNNIYKADTVSFKINLLISQFFNANVSDKEFNANDIIYHLKRNDILDDI